MGRQARVFGVAAAALLALLAVFAVELINSQATARRDVGDRFRDRARAGAALTESLFGSASATAQADNAKRYGAARVSPRTLARGARQANSRYLLLLSQDGTIISASTGAPAAAARSVQARPAYVRRVLAGAPFALSNVQRAGMPAPTFGYAQSFKTRFGRRVIVSGLDARLIGAFLGGYLKQVPNVAGGRAYVLDGRGGIVGSAQPGERAGAPIRQPQLLAALTRTQGSYGDDAYFAAGRVKDTPWRVVLTAPRGNLFASVNGSRKSVPWILFLGFGIAAAGALVLLRRVLRDSAKLTSANAQLGVANAALEQRAGELTRTNEELERFASIASHDLQEPLRKVQTFAEQLKRSEGERLSDKGADYLERMNDAARRMQALIADLLAFSRLSTQAHPTEEVRLTEVARGVVADLDAVIHETGATVEVGELPTVLADPLQMRQLLQNLVSNALKFRREGVPPVVEVKGRVSGRMAEIAVTDNGIGFEPRHAGRIFRVFERLHGHGAYTGTGIGLALCRRIAERHGGAIVADSTPGEGATFTVTLPQQPADESPILGVRASTTAKETPPLVHA
jgi:signal transduction histidine kinase